MAADNGFPYLTTAGQGLFNGASSVGMVQGQADPDPSTRFALRGGLVSSSETVPMWGGIGVFAAIPPVSSTGPSQVLGPVLQRATALSGSLPLLGFTVFDQSYNMVTDPANPVPTAGSGQSINYYPLGSRARIAVACDPSLVSLRGGTTNPQVSWDFVNQRLVPYSAAYSNTTITGAVWASTSGGRITFAVSTDLTAAINAGDDISVSGIVSTGGAGGNYNGAWVVVSVTSTTIVVTAAASSGFYGTYSSGGTVLGGGGALPVTVLDIQPSGNMTVEYAGGHATYNFNGSCAKIQI